MSLDPCKNLTCVDGRVLPHSSSFNADNREDLGGIIIMNPTSQEVHISTRSDGEDT